MINEPLNTKQTILLLKIIALLFVQTQPNTTQHNTLFPSMQRVPPSLLQKQTYDEYRTCSPMRSPLRIHPSSQTRQLSPIRVSPYSQARSRQVVMSPIRVRHTDRIATTPTRNRISVRDEFARSPRKVVEVHIEREQNYGYDSSSHYGHISQYQVNNHNGRHPAQPNLVAMEKAIKSGVGLFQKLVQQQKLGSERDRKQNRIGSKVTHNNTNTATHQHHQHHHHQQGVRQCSNGQIYSQGGLSHHSSNSNVSISQFQLYDKKKEQARNMQDNGSSNMGQMDSTVKIQYQTHSTNTNTNNGSGSGNKARINLVESFGNAAHTHMMPSVNLIESNPPSLPPHNNNNNSSSSKTSIKNKKSNGPFGSEFQQIQSQIYVQPDPSSMPPKPPTYHPHTAAQTQHSNLPILQLNPQQKPSLLCQKQQQEAVLQSLHSKDNSSNKNNPQVVTESIEMVNLLLNKVHQRNIGYRNDPNNGDITLNADDGNSNENNVRNSVKNGKNSNSSLLYSFNMNPFIN